MQPTIGQPENLFFFAAVYDSFSGYPILNNRAKRIELCNEILSYSGWRNIN